MNDLKDFIINKGKGILVKYIGKEKDVIIPDIVTKIGDWAFYNCCSIVSVEIPDTVKSMGDGVFKNCYNLKSVKIPNGVIRIGEKAFYDCSSLKSVEISDNITSIGDAAFRYCDSLTSIKIPDSVTSIGEYAFYYCDSLTSIEIPDSVTSIGGWAFGGCVNLASIVVNENNKNYKSIDGNLYSKDGKTLIKYAGGKLDTGFILPINVTGIEDGAFFTSFNLKYVGIFSSAIKIGMYSLWSGSDIVIKGYSNSLAEKYAKEHKIKFEKI